MKKKLIEKSNLLLWISLSIIILLLFLNIDMINKDNATIGMGALSIVHGSTKFIKHGGKLITPTGIFSLTSALLVGFASVYITMNTKYDLGSELFYATFIGFIAQVIIYNLSSNDKELFKETNYNQTQNIGTLKNIKIISMTFFLTGLLGSLFTHDFTMFSNAFMYIGIVMLVVIIWNRINKFSKFSILTRIFITAILFILYYLLAFDDFGRIVLATLALSITMGLNHLFKKINIKYLILLFLGPALIFAANLRTSYSEEHNADYDPSTSNVGFGSMVSPLLTFGKLLNMYWNNMIELSYGQTFWATIVIFIPRDWWEDKPYGFGRKLTEMFRPELVNAGHSEASIVYGEWLFNFGFAGILFSILVFIMSLRILDKQYFSSINKKFYSTLDFLKYVVIIIISAGLINAVWGSSITVMTREGFRVILIIIAYIVFLIIPKRKN